MKYHLLAILLFVIFPAPRGASAAESDLVTRQKIFIRDLFAQKRYFDVITETRRLMVFDRGDGNRRDYNFFININYFLGGQYRSVVAAMASRSGPRDSRESILLSQAYLKLGLCGPALETAAPVSYGAVEAPRRYPLLARKAEAYIQCGLYRELVEEVRAAERHVPDGDRLRLLSEEAEGYRRIPFKSVPLAVALSVFIPGAGQMYAGKWLQGAVSFVGVAALAGGAFLLHRQGHRNLAYTFIAFSSVFYLGTIYGAFNAARSVNEDLEGAYREKVKKRCEPAYDPVEEVRDNRVFR
ncbi:MAG: hypothetical protein KA369_18380 [Spirochaetes bacterium]|nr:hypothetical protein [Spirochaetota bacterium]